MKKLKEISDRFERIEKLANRLLKSVTKLNEELKESLKEANDDNN